MISYSRDPKQEIPSSAVKIVGLGGAGANMLERVALDSIEGAELLALNTDIRTLGASLAKEKIQLGINLTKGLGTGGDPELGQQAMLEAEESVREALKGQQIVFLCAGLGGGTGSGAAPIVARIAREEGAFVVVFATMPFFFEGRRRRDQADTALNELAVLSNALVTFDNNRMGELVLAKQGIHEAFSSADKMISESIKAVIRLVIRPGIINVGLDDLMSALRTTRSRCLFGSGMSEGKDRASKALRNALSSPLLDQGSLLKEAQTVLVHLSGGESLTLFEIELLMQNLQKHVPDHAHVLFGAAIDPAMGDNLSITLISALPEDSLTGGTRQTISSPLKSIAGFESVTSDAEEIENPFTKIDTAKSGPASDSELPAEEEKPEVDKEPTPKGKEERPFAEPEFPKKKEDAPKQAEPATDKEQEDGPELTEPESITTKKEEEIDSEDDSEELLSPSGPEVDPPSKFSASNPEPKVQPSGKPIWDKSGRSSDETDDSEDPFEAGLSDTDAPKNSTQNANLKLDEKVSGSQSELSFDSSPRGRFEGENPNVFEGEDLDLPPFLRKKKS
ncbi:hypothetical protein [Luteolibacter sp. AS25]|uniref:cell division protein FtsZ n=1 Tax=Luteolibacter sp. AS25 TaxID=3135776 RepID=UPI00398A5D1E